MPKYSQDTLESVESVIEVIESILPKDAKKELNSFKIFQRLLRVLNCNNHGRVSFKPYYIASRRKAVMMMFDGSNQASIACALDVPINIVNKDISRHYRTRRKKAI